MESISIPFHPLIQPKIGILGGLSWHSTQLYYRYLNEEYARQHGHHHSLPLVINSLNLQQVIEGFKNRPHLIQELIQECHIFTQAPCSPILIASNTVHALYSDLQRAYPQLRWLHIAECLALACKEKSICRLGLLGTRYTVSRSFYRRTLEQKGIEVIVLNRADQKQIDSIIEQELTQGQCTQLTQNKASYFTQKLHQNGAQAIALACTELPLWITNAPIPLLNTALIHCQSALQISQAYIDSLRLEDTVT